MKCRGRDFLNFLPQSYYGGAGAWLRQIMESFIFWEKNNAKILLCINALSYLAAIFLLGRLGRCWGGWGKSYPILPIFDFILSISSLSRFMSSSTFAPLHFCFDMPMLSDARPYHLLPITFDSMYIM